MFLWLIPLLTLIIGFYILRKKISFSKD